MKQVVREEIIMIGVILGIVLLGALFLHCILIMPIRHERRQSLNMLKIMPCWMVERSSGLAKLLEQ